jgi:hypothetical protein
MFMGARERFYATPGYQALDSSYKVSIYKTFLSAVVDDDRLAW